MSRQDTLDQIRTTLGIVPGFLEGMPDMALEQTWGGIRDFLMVDTALPLQDQVPGWPWGSCSPSLSILSAVHDWAGTAQRRYRG